MGFRAYAVEMLDASIGFLLMIEDGKHAVLSGPSKSIEFLARDLDPNEVVRLKGIRKGEPVEHDVGVKNRARVWEQVEGTEHTQLELGTNMYERHAIYDRPKKEKKTVTRTFETQ